MMREFIISFLLLTGSTLILFASIGIARFNDTLSRAHALTKATTFAVTLLLGALWIALEDQIIGMKLLLIILFCILTIPLSSHLVAWLYHKHLFEIDEKTRKAKEDESKD